MLPFTCTIKFFQNPLPLTPTTIPNFYDAGTTGSQAPSGVIMTRKVGSVTHTLTYDAENHLIEVKKNSATIATFVYNGDGDRVKSMIGSTTTAFVSNYLEWTGSATTMKSYYYAGSTRVAMRAGSSTLNFILGDHLGSASVTTSSTGTSPKYQLYKPFGEVRYTSSALPTKYTFTGQYSNVSDFGLMYYGARWYDVSLGRFAQADTIIPQPGNPQSWDRYAYTLNSPLMYTDPSGHQACGNSYSDPECPIKNQPKITNSHTYKNMTPDQFLDQSGWEPQMPNHPSGCGPFSIAFASNLAYGTQYSGADVESTLEGMGLKIPGVGIPGASYKSALDKYMRGANVSYKTGATIGDLTGELDKDNLVIVLVSWQTNWEVSKDLVKQMFQNGNGPSVGHYKLAVGYENNTIIFLDPGRSTGETGIEYLSYSSLNAQWYEKSNFAISPGTMYVLSVSTTNYHSGVGSVPYGAR